MKKLFKRIALVLAASLVGLAASAQDFASVADNDTGRDEEGHVVRGSYLTNEWYDNWSFILSGGGHTTISSGDLKTARLTPTLEISALKWFTPNIGMRGGLQGFWMQERIESVWVGNHYQIKRNPDTKVNYYNELYAHADLMLSVSNFFWGYRRNRFANVVPYAHAGYLRLSHPDEPLLTTKKRDREVGAGFGLYTQFRIANAVCATLDIRNTTFSGRYHNESEGGVVSEYYAAVGMSYTIKKWYWSRSKVLEDARDNAIAAVERAEEMAKQVAEEKKALTGRVMELNNQVEDLNQQVEVLYKEVDEAKEEAVRIANADPEDELMARIAKSDMVLYYDINSEKLSSTEILRMDAYIRETCARNPWHVFYITGSADDSTGTEAHNIRLCHARAEGIKKVLIRKYGIPEGQVIIKAIVVSHEHDDARFDRCVFFENQ